MSKITPVFVALIILLLDSCAETVSFDEPYHLKNQHSKINARLDDRLATLTESSSSMGETGTYQVGKALAYVIQNTPDSGLSLSYVSSDLDNAVNLSWYMSDSFTAEYKLVILAESNTRREIIEVTGKGGSHRSTFAAHQQAMEKAVLSLYLKLSALFGPTRLAQ